MKVLWITNILFPDICKRLGVDVPVVGGWMKSSAQALLDANANIEMAVATLYGKEYRKDVINGITYYCLPFEIYRTEYNPALEDYWKRIANDFNPDVVHIHGTEFPHGLAYIRAMGATNVVVSIQGLVGAYARYSLGGISIRDLKKCMTFYDLLKGHICNSERQMGKQGLLENEYLKLAHHVIGRTEWDKDHVWSINPNVEYHFCNETLRTPFYKLNWTYEECEKHSIFLSQAHKPIKGLHKIVQALPLVKREFPDVKVFVAGSNFFQKRTLKQRLKYGAYANYVLHLMEQYDVKSDFMFTGLLDEDKMAEMYLKTNVFVCPSSIENSPNSLGEAQLVGTPVIASYVGGVPDMVTDGETGLLYRFEEHEMLAKYICDVFKDVKFANKISTGGKNAALQRHDKEKNAVKTIEIYKAVIGKA